MNFEEINYQEILKKQEYTEVQQDLVVEPEILNIIINSYAGVVSEFTATSQYSYQSFLTEVPEPYLHEILEAIAINEMFHLEIFSQILLSQKITPKYCKYIDNNINICSNWSANYVNYETDIKKFIEYNISVEKKVINTYSYIINTTTSTNLKEIFTEILSDHKAHLQIFNMLLDILNK